MVVHAVHYRKQAKDRLIALHRRRVWGARALCRRAAVRERSGCGPFRAAGGDCALRVYGSGRRRRHGRRACREGRLPLRWQVGRSHDARDRPDVRAVVAAAATTTTVAAAAAAKGRS
eukprot:6206546-Pleurochrysis_carterae.AAC.11